MSHVFLRVVSQLFGWIYTILWSLSFYPQPRLNYQRQSTIGTTIDFPAINVLGFIAYFLSTTIFLYSSQIREEYALRNKGLTPTVQFNDVAFAAHAIVLSALTLSQFFPSIWGFDNSGARRPVTRPSKPILGIAIGSVVGVAIVALIVAARDDQDVVTGWAWIDVIYAISYVKLFITLVKYTPQVITNHHNKSTAGWSIGQILFDIVGGFLSIAQLAIDSYLQRDWSGITGNPVKLALGNISIFFDIIFMIQHYGLYKGSEGIAFGEDGPLLEGNEREQHIH